MSGYSSKPENYFDMKKIPAKIITLFGKHTIV
jgi:hypothetical protein